MVRPLLLLDVDGVLNPYGTPQPPAGFTEHDLFPGEGPVRLNPEHGAWITEVRGVVDVAWATAWNDDANRLLCPLLRLRRMPVVDMPAAPFHPDDKVERIDEYARHRPAAWLDDLHTLAAFRWAATRRSPTLLVPVDPAVGLTREAVDRVLAWAATV